MAADFRTVLESKKRQVWPIVDHCLKESVVYPPYCQIPPTYRNLLKYHLDLISNYPQRQGKYLRPALVLLTCEAMGGDPKQALTTAAAMQLSEEWILVHDDIEDDSDKRRGQPTLHCLYGQNLAFNAGDALHVLMWEMLSNNQLSPLTQKQVIDEFYRILNRTVFGQTVELKWTEENKLDLSDNDVLFIMESKTGYYTIAGPMRLGAIIAGANNPQLNSLYRFGKMLGQCFQIIDDLLDLTSDFEGQKNQPGSDLYEGKRTIPLAHLLRTASSRDKQQVVDILNKPRSSKTPKDVAIILALMKQYGSLDHSRRLANRLAQKAKQLFDNNLTFLSSSPAREEIAAGVEFILNRKY